MRRPAPEHLAEPSPSCVPESRCTRPPTLSGDATVRTGHGNATSIGADVPHQ
ncbi:MAG TPA: hypothetical protein VNP92_13160 [Actinophytocola sp.]|nr:hypothetical protein [Actinophytocola sp.]